MAIINFDARGVAPDTGRVDPFPAGWYNVVAKELNLEPTKDGMGTKITGKFEVVDGQFRGRTVYHNFNMKNASEKAQEIGHKQFSALCHACRILMVQDTAQLLNIPLKVRVKVTPGDGQFEPRNEITAFKDINDTTVGNAGALVPGSATVAAPAASAPVAPPPVGQAPAWGAAPAAAAQPAAAPAAAPAASWNPPAAQQPWAQAPNAAQPAPAVTATAPATPTPTPAPAAAPAPAQASPTPTELAMEQGGAIVPPWLQQQ